ncbi:class I SAM-dependent methyltransferase [Macrococcus capreoli]|uniref:class I SAM-dependent methyltransferase n=1 Tax=Macrococcus capreoli TaxID=2982690 RepID=UPI0021D577B5|nr:class I SAM-dependent methyltransferase [Macrococcus sp. TMW 2.2395]MCU7558363.1 class I SAM-dependent methyltransferase [Macrococcus sp. TMW 2.2395]
MIEELFKLIDDKAKTFQQENGHSFIENLGLALEDIYMNERDTLEKSTVIDRRKAFQFAYLSMLKEEMIQPNHQMTPDSIGYLVAYVIRLFMQDEKNIKMIDLTSGTGHLSATIHEQNPEITFDHVLVEVDPVLSRLSVHLANFLEVPMDVFPQDAIMPLPETDFDIAVGDFPIGYYPVDERSHAMKLGFKEGHSFSHHLLIEQAVASLKPGGLAFLIVPSMLFEGEHVEQLQKFIATETVMQAFLNFPTSLFKSENLRKSLLVLENKKVTDSKPVEVLLANIPDFKDERMMKSFLDDLETWYSENRNK